MRGEHFVEGVIVLWKVEQAVVAQSRPQQRSFRPVDPKDRWSHRPLRVESSAHLLVVVFWGLYLGVIEGKKRKGWRIAAALILCPKLHKI